MGVEIDFNFPKLFPFGQLKVAQLILSLAIYITLFFPDYHYTGVGFVNFVSLNSFLYSVISLLCHMLGIHRRTFQFGNNFVFIPFTICDFFAAIVFLFGYGISALICILSMLDGLRYKGNMFVCFLILSLFSLAAGAAFGYFAIMIYRNCPNGRISNLTGVVTEGDKLVSAELRTNNAADPNVPPV